MTLSAFARMTEEDLDEVARCEQAAARFPWSRRNFQDALLAGNSCWLLRDAEQVVVQGVFMSVLDEAHLLILSVHPQMQRKGFGRHMLEHLLERARLVGAASMFLEVRAGNTAALALYQDCGFEGIGRRKAYYPAEDGGREDAIVMRRKLS